MTAAGLIFSNIHDSNIPELTRYRTLASVPFGCRYRLSRASRDGCKRLALVGDGVLVVESLLHGVVLTAAKAAPAVNEGEQDDHSEPVVAAKAIVAGEGHDVGR